MLTKSSDSHTVIGLLLTWICWGGLVWLVLNHFVFSVGAQLMRVFP